jgi:uncharacterized protein
VIRVVVDTNVLVSGIRNRRGNEAQIIGTIQRGILAPCFSEVIFAEYVEVLARSKFGFLTDEVATLLATIRSRGQLFEPDPWPLVVLDRSDAKFMACAMAAQADYLVTGNRRDFPEKSYGSARVVNARELMDFIAPEG